MAKYIFLRVACVVLALAALTGCVVAPARPYHPAYYYYR
jgi:hypothetical protein